MNGFKRSLWAATAVCTLIIVFMMITMKLIVKPIISEQQEALISSEQLNSLPEITSLDALHRQVDTTKFNYIAVHNTQLLTPLVFQNKTDNYLFSGLFTIPSTLINSDNSSQTIEFSAKNTTIKQLYSVIISLFIATLILIFIACSIISFRLFKHIERKLVNEVLDINSQTTFNTVTSALKQQTERFNQTLEEKQVEIEKLKQPTNKDNLTGVKNREAFRKELTAFLSDDRQNFAILSIIRTFELSAINMSRVLHQGEDYETSIASIISKVLQKFNKINVYRLNGTDFAIIAYDVSIIEAQNFSAELKLKFDEYQAFNNLDNVAFHGLTPITSNQLPEHVLARVDMALAKAQTGGVNAWAFEDSQDTLDFQMDEQHWRKTITDMINNRAYVFLQQPIQPVHQNMKGYQEIFTRFISDHGNTIPTGTIFSMAQRTDTLIKLEQSIIERIVHHCRTHIEGNDHWGLNISSMTLQNSSFIVWLERLLLRYPEVAATLVFEVNEGMLESNLTSSKRFFDMLKRVGSRSAICSFGKGIGSFRLFKELKPSYIKIDSHLINNIENDSANQQFVRMIIESAHRMDCQVIAEGIEHIEQKKALEKMYLDGIQGYLIAHPTPL
jgi:EAL domain-containing protein (putative c-di-GMP-specific phosphodiesterase class I)/GGDEF domain-containing protein